MEQSPRFALPFLVPGQAQKELLHNEALQMVEMLLCPVVKSTGSAVAPPDPQAGDCHIVGSDASGDWTGREDQLACFTEGGWRFVSPIESMIVTDQASGHAMAFREGGWENGIVRARELVVEGQAVVRERQADIADPSGGAVSDQQCRATVSAMLSALPAHGLIG